MRRFFRASREDDCSQIQYLTAKVNRLAHEKAVLERDVLVSRERERSQQNDLEALAAQLYKQEHVNVELRIKHDQLVTRVHYEQDVVEFLQQRVHALVEGGSRDAALLGLQLEQVNSELLHLLTSEVQLQGLVEELHTEAFQKAVEAESLQAQLHRKSSDLEELERSSVQRLLIVEEQHGAHQRRVQQLEQENAGCLRKLQETAEQFEWLCEQQRHWICCVKRFKDCLSEEKEALAQQVTRLEKEVSDLRGGSVSPDQSQHCPLEATHSRTPSWEADEMADLQAQVDKGRVLYEDLFSQLTPNQGDTLLAETKNLPEV